MGINRLKEAIKLHGIWFLLFLLFLFSISLTFYDPNERIGDLVSELKAIFPDFIVNYFGMPIIVAGGFIFLFFAIIGVNSWGADEVNPKLIRIRFFISSIILAIACYGGIKAELNQNQWIYFDSLFVLQLLSYGMTFKNLKIPASLMFGALLLSALLGVSDEVWLFYDSMIILFLTIIGFYILISKMDVIKGFE